MNLKIFLIATVACAMATAAVAQTRDTNGDGKIDKAETLAGTKARFESMDANKDGRLSLAETTRGDEVDRARLAARGDTAGFTLDAMLASSAEYFDRQDTDKDGFMSRDELRAGVQAGLRGSDANGDGKRDKAEHLSQAREMFERMDTDKDGKVGALTLADAQARAAAGFDKADTNRDGFMSPEETRASLLASINQDAGRQSQ